MILKNRMNSVIMKYFKLNLKYNKFIIKFYEIPRFNIEAKILSNKPCHSISSHRKSTSIEIRRYNNIFNIYSGLSDIVHHSHPAK